MLLGHLTLTFLLLASRVNRKARSVPSIADDTCTRIHAFIHTHSLSFFLDHNNLHGLALVLLEMRNRESSGQQIGG